MNLLIYKGSSLLFGWAVTNMRLDKQLLLYVDKIKIPFLQVPCEWWMSYFPHNLHNLLTNGFSVEFLKVLLEC